MPWLIGLGVLGAAAAGYVLYRFIKKYFSGPDPDAQPQDGQNDQSPQQAASQQKEPIQTSESGKNTGYLTEKEQKVQELLNQDGSLKDLLLQRAGMSRKTKGLSSLQIVKQVAAKVFDEEIEVFFVAATHETFNIQLEKNVERVVVPYPTRYIQPVPIIGLDQVTEILPEQLMQTPAEFCSNLVQNQLVRLESSEYRVEQKLVYLVVDASLSMKELLCSGYPRHTLARGLVVQLLLRAMQGEAKYFLRYFGTSPHPLREITTQEQAEALAKKTFQEATLDESGTNIGAALNVAIRDIREKGGLISQSEILLITDGEDQSVDANNLRQRMGTDIRLHVVLIDPIRGTSIQELQKAATNFKVWR
jgi:hypothetical protein